MPRAADVAARTVVKVEPAEAQTVLDRVELGQLLGVAGGRRVPLGTCLRRAAALAQASVEPAGRLLAQVVELAVEHPDVFLFLLQIDLSHPTIIDGVGEA